MLLTVAAILSITTGAAADDDDDDGPAKPVTELLVTAKRLDAARANIEPTLGASTYTIANEAVESRPGGESMSIGRVLLQAPGVLQDGSGQLRVRQSHGDLQYRINNIILPEGLSDLGESLSTRIAQRVELVTGALPAQYGFQAGGVVNITTKNGAYLNGGQAEIYGGGRGEIEPAFEYGSNIGPTNLFLSGSFHGSAHPLHDRGDQVDGFAFVDHILNPLTRVSLILGLSDDRFQVPNQRGLNAASAISASTPVQRPFTVAGVSAYPSDKLNDRRRDATRYAVASMMRATDDVTVQAGVFFRESVRTERANDLGDLLFTGIARESDALDVARGVQVEAVYELATAHTLRGGVVGSWSRTKSLERAQVIAVDGLGRQLTDQPRTLIDDTRLATQKKSIFAQDEWRPIADVTVNLGLRFDDVQAVQHDSRLSPRVNAVWTFPAGATLHAGYARYFLAAPTDGAGETPKDFAGTSAAPPTPQGDPLRAETDDYYDVGMGWIFDHLTLGIDGYWRAARNFIAEGAFGPAHISRPFNYDQARIRGLEFTATFAEGPITAWSNLALARGQGQTIVSNQFYFAAADLAAIAARRTPLSYDQTVTASAGLSYRWGALRIGGDALYGSGLPTTRIASAPNGSHLPGYAQINLALRYTLRTLGDRPLELRLDIINLFDARYRLRDGTGLGDGMPQWGPRRGVFAGVEQSF